MDDDAIETQGFRKAGKVLLPRAGGREHHTIGGDELNVH
jgi:hypothetical protein